MTSRQDDVPLGDAPDDARAARLDAEIAAFSFDVTEIRDARAFAAALHDDDGELIAGLQGWTWGATCWVERLWVREDGRHRNVGRRLMAAVEAEARTRVCGQLALTTHRSSTIAMCERRRYRLMPTQRVPSDMVGPPL